MRYVVFTGIMNVFFKSVTRWCKKFKDTVDLVKRASYARRLKTVILPNVNEKVNELIATDASFKFGI